MGCVGSKAVQPAQAPGNKDTVPGAPSVDEHLAERVKSVHASKPVTPPVPVQAAKLKKQASPPAPTPPLPPESDTSIASSATAKDIDDPATDDIPITDPVVPLVERAVHPLFLAAVSQIEVEMEGRGRVKLGDLYTHEVVSIFIKPQTAHMQTSLVETLALMVMEDEERAAAGQERMLVSSTSRDRRGVSGPGTELAEVLSKYRAWAGGNKPFQGPATYFLSHAWCYKLGDLRDMAKSHYEMVTGSEYKYSSVFYWIDIFAVNQNFTGDFTKHPDGNFPSVIRNSEGVVFTMFPWNEPIAPKRIWCLFEAVTAVETGVALELLVDGEFRNAKLSVEQLQASFKETVKALDIGAAQATVESDRQMILEMVRSREGGIPKFNQFLQQLLDSRMQEMLLLRTVAAQDVKLANTLLSMGATFFHKHLKFKMARITDISAEIIAGALKANTTITSLDLTPPNDKGLLSYKGANAIAGALCTNNTLVELDLSYHRSLGDEGVHALATALQKSNKTLQVLKLNKAGVDDAAASELASLLQVNSTLTCLDLGSNDELKEEGACALFDGLQLNTTLRRLDLTASKLNDRSAWIALGNMLKYNSSLEILILAHCGLSSKAMPYIGPGLEENKRLMLLDLCKNPLGKGLAVLAPHIGKNRQLVEVMLSDCGVELEGAEALRDALRSNSNIIHVGLSGNKVCKRDWEELTAHTSSIGTMISIDSVGRGMSGAGITASGAGTVVLWVPANATANGFDPASVYGTSNALVGSSLIAANFKTNLQIMNSKSHINISGNSWTPLSAIFNHLDVTRPGTRGYSGMCMNGSGSSMSGASGAPGSRKSIGSGSHPGDPLSRAGSAGLLQGSILAKGSVTLGASRLRTNSGMVGMNSVTSTPRSGAGVSPFSVSAPPGSSAAAAITAAAAAAGVAAGPVSSQLPESRLKLVATPTKLVRGKSRFGEAGPLPELPPQSLMLPSGPLDKRGTAPAAAAGAAASGGADIAGGKRKGGAATPNQSSAKKSNLSGPGKAPAVSVAG